MKTLPHKPNHQPRATDSIEAMWLVEAERLAAFSDFRGLPGLEFLPDDLRWPDAPNTTIDDFWF